MKILVCTQMFPTSDKEAIVSGMIKNPYNQTVALSESGCDVDVITTGETIKKYRISDIDVWSVGNGCFKGVVKSFIYEMMIFLCFLKLRGWKRYDVIHVHHLNIPLLVVLKLLGWLNAKLVYTAHGTSTPELNAAKQGSALFYFALRFNGVLQHALDRFSWCNADLVLSPSKFQVKEMVDMYSVPEANIKVIYNGVDSDLFKPDIALRQKLRNDIRVSDDDFVVLFVGRAASKKGVDYLIYAMDSVHDLFPNTKLLLVLGYLGRQKNYLDKIILLAKERKYIDLRINVPERDLPKFYNAADLSVFPSLGYESIPTVIFESIACGLPILTQGSWGIPEVLKGQFIDEESILCGELGENIGRLIKDQDLLKKDGENNFIESKTYHWSRGGQTLKNVYQAVLSGDSVNA
ncbi:MAG: glycosyltransferase family 4 protein [Candidatus Pelagadaptatus aseana]|uniref:glycosyltransferase family 4 protein n=1 Tax=Candidatus Pelagadaptatus aseana TaxID=3120508 RepID=UPI0039B1C6C3